MAEMSGREIYDNFHNGVGAEGLATGAAMVKQIAARYQERVVEIHQLVRDMESAWQGEAAGGARRGAGPLLTEHEVAAHHLGVAEDLTDRQSGSFSRAKNSVVPVPPAPAEVPPWGPLSAEWAPYMRRVQEHNSAAQHNVDVMNSYSGASSYNTEHLPSRYGELADDQAGVVVSDADTINSEVFRRSGAGDVSTGDVAGTGSERTGSSAGPNRDAPLPVPGQPTPTTTPGGYSPVSGQYPGTSLPTGDFGPARPAPTGGAPVSGLGVLGLGTGGYAPDVNRGGPGEAGRPRGGGPTGGLLPRGGTPGVGAEPARGTSAPGPAAPRGAGMTGVPLAAGRGRGEEDTERRTPTYLEGGDPEDLFGNDLLTAPPVIGDEDDD